MANILLLAGPGSRWKRSQRNTAGFLAGLWHGFLFPLTFWISLIFPSVRIYETHNSGRWYDFGFLVGTSITLGGSARHM